MISGFLRTRLKSDFLRVHHVWVRSENGTLNIRAVTVLARDPRHVVIGDDLGEDDQVILSHIASPLKGMPLRSREIQNP